MFDVNERAIPGDRVGETRMELSGLVDAAQRKQQASVPVLDD